MSFFINIWVRDMKRNLSIYSEIILYYNTRIQLIEGIFNEGFRNILKIQLPLLLSVMHTCSFSSSDRTIGFTF